MRGDLPKGWELINLHEAAKDLFAGGDVPKDRMSKEWTEEFQIPIYGNGLSEGGLYGFTDIPKVDQECITISARGTIGFPIHRTTSFYPIVRLIVLVPKPSLNTKYIFYYLKSVDFINTGTSIPQLTVPQVRQLNIPLPPFSEQQRIVARLDAIFAHLDVLKEKLDRIPELLKNFRQQVLTRAVTGELTREWREGKDLGEWEETTIGDLFEVKTGGTPRRGVKEYYEGGNIPWVKSGLVKNELIFEADEFITELAIRDSNVKIFPIDTLLVAMYGEGKTRGQVGWLKIEATTNQAIAALVNETMPIDTRTYVFYYCLSQYNDIRSKAEGGNQPNLNLSKIKEWEISVPPEEEQKEIVSRINSLFNVSDKIESQYQSLNAKIGQLPQAVLAKAFRGELVSQEVKEYVREVGELGMVAEELKNYEKS